MKVGSRFRNNRIERKSLLGMDFGQMISSHRPPWFYKQKQNLKDKYYRNIATGDDVKVKKQKDKKQQRYNHVDGIGKKSRGVITAVMASAEKVDQRHRFCCRKWSSKTFYMFFKPLQYRSVTVKRNTSCFMAATSLV